MTNQLKTGALDEMMTAKKQHDNMLDNIRCIAIITVVIGHSIILYSNNWGIYNPERSSVVFDYAKRVINLYQMPLFFSLSGYLFAKTFGNTSGLKYLCKKVKRVLLPFFAVGFLWMIPIKILAHYPPYSECSIGGVIIQFLDGTDTGHLWFLPTLFTFFTAACAITKLFKNRLSTWLITFVFGVLVYLFVSRIPQWRVISVYLKYFAEFFWSFSLGAILYWGRETLNTRQKATRRKNLLRLILVFCSIAGIAAAVLLSEKLWLPVSITIVTTLYLIVPEKENRIARTISRNSFGLYLFHSPLIYITFIFALNYPPVVVAAINLIVWGAVAFFLTIGIRKTPLKIIIGE